MSVSKDLKDMVRSKFDSSEVLLAFNQRYATTRPPALVRYFRDLLNCAIEAKHTELLTVLLADPRCNVTSDFSSAPYPMFVVLETRDVEVIDVFLNSNVAVDAKTKRHHEIASSDNKQIRVLVSAIEYACYIDDREMLKKLVLFDIEENKDKIIQPNRFSIQLSTALHVIVSLLNETNPLTGGKVDVRELTRIVLALTDWSAHLSTCLDLLILKVTIMTRDGVVPTDEYQRQIIEIAELLLKAFGCSTICKNHDREMRALSHNMQLNNLTALLKKTVHNIHKQFTSRQLPGNNLSLIAEFIKLYFMNHAELLACWRDDQTLSNSDLNVIGIHAITTHIVYLGEELTRAVSQRKMNAKLIGFIGEDLIVFDSMIDTLADIFRYFWSTGSGPNSTDLFPVKDTRFMEAFVSIAGYASELGRSRSLFTLLLTSMSLTELNILSKGLNKRVTELSSAFQRRFKGISNKHYDLMLSAADRIRTAISVQHPSSLQYLARQAITRAIPYRVLVNNNILGLPMRLHRYILSHDAGNFLDD